MPERDVCDRARQALDDYERAVIGTWTFAGEVLAFLPELVAEVERLRANQRVEELEPWLGKCKGGQ